MKPIFTLAICTRNRSSQLHRLLESVASIHAEARLPWDCVVVDNASTDDTSGVVASRVVNFPMPLRLVVEHIRGLSHARNRALLEAEGDYVVFLDDDVTVQSGWCRALEVALIDGRLGAVGGRIVGVAPENAEEEFLRFVAQDWRGPIGEYDLGPKDRDAVPGDAATLPCGGNMAVAKRAALEVGAFRVDLGIGKQLVLGEDTEFMSRLLAAGFRVRYLAGAVVEHHLQPEKATMKHLREWHVGFGRFQVKTKSQQTSCWKMVMLARCLFDQANYRFRIAASLSIGSCRSRRKLWQSTGRLLQLCGR